MKLKKKVDVNQHKKRLTEKIRMRKLDEIPYKHIILDCSCMNFIDSQGVDTILKVKIKFKNENIYKLIKKRIDNFSCTKVLKNWKSTCI